MSTDALKEFISKLSWVDYIAMVALLRGFYTGYKAGFFHELLRVATIVVTLVVTMVFFEPMAQFLTLHTFLNLATARISGFCVLLVGAFLATKIVELVLVKVLRVSEGGVLNSLFGMVIGGARLLVLLSFLFIVVDICPVKQLQEDVHKRSLTGDKIAQVAPTLLEFFSQFSPKLSVSNGKEK